MVQGTTQWTVMASCSWPGRRGISCGLWYRFKNFCNDFTARHPGFYVAPLRLNGSAIETLFSQLKFISHGDLSATRYPQALASLITRGSIHSHPVAGSATYRDAVLYVCQHELKKYPRKQD